MADGMDDACGGVAVLMASSSLLNSSSCDSSTDSVSVTEGARAQLERPNRLLAPLELLATLLAHAEDAKGREGAGEKEEAEKERDDREAAAVGEASVWVCACSCGGVCLLVMLLVASALCSRCCCCLVSMVLRCAVSFPCRVSRLARGQGRRAKGAGARRSVARPRRARWKAAAATRGRGRVRDESLALHSRCCGCKERGGGARCEATASCATGMKCRRGVRNKSSRNSNNRTNNNKTNMKGGDETGRETMGVTHHEEAQ